MKRNYYFFLMVLFILSSCSGAGGQGQAASATQTKTSIVYPTATPSPTNTPKTKEIYIPNANLPKVDLTEFVKNYDMYASAFPLITFEDYHSEKFIENEKTYVSASNIFDDEIFQNDLYLNWLNGFGTKSKKGKFDPQFIDILSNALTKGEPDTRPFKRISIYRIKNNIFSELGINTLENDAALLRIRRINNSNKDIQPVWSVTYAYHNPSGNITLVRSLVDILSYVDNSDIVNTGKYGFPKDRELYPAFLYDFKNITMSESDISTYNFYLTYAIYKKYPELKPNINLINVWTNTKEMPTELQNDIFSMLPFAENLW